MPMSSVPLYKYSGAGNDFIVVSALSEQAGISAFRECETIRRLCDRKSGVRAADGRIGADGLMILGGTSAISPGVLCDSQPTSFEKPNPSNSPVPKRLNNSPIDFRMEYFNSDGSGGMMCGNGGRCIVAFAEYMGIKPHNGQYYVFEAPDGFHTGEILSKEGTRCIVRLSMTDAFGLKSLLGGWFLNTGTRHFVKFVEDVEKVDVEKEGAKLRWAPEFAPEGANINFVSITEDGTLKIRTFEKGVEAETLACGTGITASAIATHFQKISPGFKQENKLLYKVRARIEELSVEFIPCDEAGEASEHEPNAKEVYLTGSAERIEIPTSAQDPHLSV